MNGPSDGQWSAVEVSRPAPLVLVGRQRPRAAPSASDLDIELRRDLGCRGGMEFRQPDGIGA